MRENADGTTRRTTDSAEGRSRHTIIQGAAWSVPVVAGMLAVPGASASVPPCEAIRVGGGISNRSRIRTVNGVQRTSFEYYSNGPIRLDGAPSADGVGAIKISIWSNQSGLQFTRDSGDYWGPMAMTGARNEEGFYEYAAYYTGSLITVGDSVQTANGFSYSVSRFNLDRFCVTYGAVISYDGCDTPFATRASSRSCTSVTTG